MKLVLSQSTTEWQMVNKHILDDKQQIPDVNLQSQNSTKCL